MTLSDAAVQRAPWLAGLNGRELAAAQAAITVAANWDVDEDGGMRYMEVAMAQASLEASGAQELAEALRFADHYRAAFIAREYEPGSTTVIEVFDRIRAALAKWEEAP